MVRQGYHDKYSIFIAGFGIHRHREALDLIKKGDRSLHMTHLPYIVVDVETTGLNPQNGDRVIEGGALKLINNDIVEEFHSLINISEKISIGAQHIHGISRDMLEEWPKAGQVFPRLKTFIGDAMIIAHNAQFDMNFLRVEFDRISHKLANRFTCTLALSRARYPRLPNHRLETVYWHIARNRAAVQSHRSMADARMVAEIWRVMGEKS